jgi:hypothetical protein
MLMLTLMFISRAVFITEHPLVNKAGNCGQLEINQMFILSSSFLHKMGLSEQSWHSP